MATVNALTYMKNVGRSLGYSVIDTLKSYNPTVVAAADNAKTYTTDLYHAVKDFNASLKEKKDANEATLMGDVKDTLNEIWANTKSDLLSGNLYNKQRIKSAEDEAMKAMLGDFDLDFDDDFGDFDFDDDMGDDDTDKVLSAEMESAKAIVTGADIIGAKMSGSINSTTVAVGDHIAKSQERSSKAIYSLTERGFGQITVGLSALNSNLTVLSAVAEPLNVHMQNSATFYAKSTEFQNKMLEMMEKVVNNTDNGGEKNRGSGSSTSNRISDLITSDGVIDLKAYSEMVMKNIRNYTDIAKDMLDMMGGVKGAGKLVSGSPISIALNFGMNKIMPKLMKESMENFNKMLADFMPVALDKLRGTHLNNPILDFLKDFAMPETSVKVTYNPGKYEKGKMPWDGISRRALTYVLPMHLARIETAITGRASKMYNYDTGRWIYPSQVKREHNDMLKRTAKYSSDASYTIDSILREQQRKGNISEKDQKRMSSQFENFLVKSMESGNTDYLNFMKDNFRPGNYGMDQDTWKFVKEVIRYKENNGDYKFRNNMNAGIVRSRDEITQKFSNMENSGDDMMMAMLFDNGVFDENRKQRHVNSFLTSVTDEYNNNIFNYLQGIYLHIKHVSDNLGALAVRGGKIKGTKITTDGKIEPIGTITFNTKNSAPKDDKYEETGEVYGPTQQAANALTNIADAIDSASGEVSTLSPELRDYQRLKEAYKGSDWKSDKNYDANKERRLELALKASATKTYIKGWLGDTALGKGLNKFFEALGKPADIVSKRVSGLFDAVGVSLNNKLYGEENEGGILDYLREIRNDFRNIFSKLADKLGFAFFGKRDEDGNFDNSKIAGRMFNESRETLKNIGSYIKNKFSFAGGGMVTKTGLATLHAGEYVIPTGRGTEEDEDEELEAAIKGEMAEGRSFFFAKHFAKKKLEAKRKYHENWRKENEKLQQEMDELKEKINNSPLGKLVNFTKTGAETLGKGVLKTFQEIFGDPEKDKKELEETYNKTRAKFSEIFGEDGEGGLGGIGAGAVVGGGLSILTGCIVNPILGASIGAGIGLIKKSKTVQQLLFGTEDNQTELQKAMSKFITEQLPDTAIGAGVGGLAGTLFLGSPLLGTILGAGVGFASASDKVKNYLFGEGDIDNGVISKELQAKVKKALPNIGAGAIAGLIAGPFGIVGNLLVGSALGYATSTEQFKEWFFGKEDEDGNRVGGITEILRKNIKEVKTDIVKPLLGIFDKLAEEFRQGFKDMTHKIRNKIADIGADLVNRLVTSARFRAIMDSAPVRGIRAIGGRIIRSPYNLIKGGLASFNDRLQRRALTRGYRVKDTEGNLLDVIGRQAEAERLGIKNYSATEGGSIDAYLGNMSSEALRGFEGDLEAIMKGRDRARLKNDRTRLHFRLHNLLMKYIGKDTTMAADCDNMITVGMKTGDFSNLKSWVESQEEMGAELKSIILATITATEAAAKNFLGREQAITKVKELMGNKSISIDRLRERVNIETASKEKSEAAIDAEKDKDAKNKLQEAVTKTIPDSIHELIDVIKWEAADENERQGLKNPFKAPPKPKTNEELHGTESAAELLDDLFHANELGKEGDTREEGGKTQIFHNGKWMSKEDYETDVEFKKSITKNIPFLSGIKGVFGKIGDLLGVHKVEPGEKKKGPLQRILEGLFGDGSETNPGFLGGILRFLTGKTFSLATIGSAIKGLSIVTLMTAAFSGMLNGIVEKIFPGYGGGDNSSGGRTSVETATTKSGISVTKNTEGQWVDANGNIYSATDISISSIRSERVDTASLSEKLWVDAGRGIASNRRSWLKVGTKQLTKPGSLGGKIANLGRSAINNLDNIILSDTGADICFKLIEKLTPILAKFGITPRTTENMCVELFDIVEKQASKRAAKGAAKGLAKGATKEIAEDATKAAFAPAEIVFIAVDFASGYEDARTTLGIVDDPNIGQRIISGLLRAIKNLIPLVGPVIPDSLVIDVFAKFIAPALGMDVSELTDARNRAQATLEAYNEATGSNITDIGEFNKKVLKDYTITERGLNAFTSEFNKLKAGGARLGSNIAEHGLIKGVGTTISQYAGDIGSGFLTAFKESDNALSGVFNGISEAISNVPIAGEIASTLPKLFGYMTSGDLKGLWTESLDAFEGGNETIEGTDLKTAAPGIFSRLYGMMMFFPFRVLLTPFTLATKLGLAIKDKLEGLLSPIIDPIKEFTTNGIQSIFDFAKDAGETLSETIENVKEEHPVIGGMLSAAKMTAGIVLAPAKLMFTIGEKIGGFLQPIVKKFGSTAFKQTIDVLKSNIKYTLDGDSDGMFKNLYATETRDDGKEHNVFSKFQKVVGNISAIILNPIATTIGTGKELWKFVKNFKDNAANVFNSIKDSIGPKIESMTTGDIKGLWENTVFDNDRDSMSPWATIANTAISTVLSLPTITVLLGKSIGDRFKKYSSAFTENYDKYDEYTDNLKDIAASGSIKDLGKMITQSSPSYNSDDPIHPLWTVFGWFSKTTLTITKILGLIGEKLEPLMDKVEEVVDVVEEHAEPIVDKVKSTGETAKHALGGLVFGGAKIAGDYISDQYDNWFGTGSRLAGKGFVSQRDPRYAGMRMGNGESVADSGCAPAVASMVSQYYGKPMSMQQAVNRSSAYQTANGTTIDYFGNALSGGSTIDTAPIRDTNGVMSNLASGHPVIMLGQDGRNTSKSRSPFGPGSHYVLGTGIDRSGNIVVNDPEQSGPRSYSPSILRGLKSAIGTRAGGSSKMHNMKLIPIKARLAGKGNVESRRPEIWSWLHTVAGLNDVQAAAVMGCFECESGNSPKRIECDYLYNYNIDWDSVATDEGLDAYCVNKVFPKYKKGVNQSAYLHDGHYYPGLGLAQWTGGRSKNLVIYAKSKGRAWYDLETQLDYFLSEMMGSYKKVYDSLRSCNDLADATEIFARGFEHGAFKKGTDHYNNRYNAAQTIYAQFVGQPFVGISGYDTARGGSKVSAIDKLLQIALAEEGYHEHDSEATVQQMGGTGHDNWNKYGYLTGHPHDMWCASYVSWVYDKLVDGDKNKFAALLGGGPSAACSTLRTNAINAGLYTDTPSVGDVVIFGTKGGRNASHTGIVTGVNPDGTYNVINGNASDKVSHAKNVSKSGKGKQYTDGFIHPRWNDVFPGMVDSYTNPYSNGNGFGGMLANGLRFIGNAMTSYNGTANGATGESGSLLSDITGIFKNVFSNIFNVGRVQSDGTDTTSNYSTTTASTGTKPSTEETINKFSSAISSFTNSGSNTENEGTTMDDYNKSGKGSKISNPYVSNYGGPKSTSTKYAARGADVPASANTNTTSFNIDKSTAILLKTIITCIETVASNTSSINGIYEILTEMAKHGGSTEAALAAIEAANINKNTQVDGALDNLKATVDAILAS